MKRLSALLFFTLYLLSTTEASQLLKIPVILQHYHEHQKLNKDISFFAFLDMHYMHGSPHDDDYDRDMQLPFKRFDHHASLSPVTVPAPVGIIQSNTIPPVSPVFIIRNDDHLYSKYHPAIFQPPRN